MLLCVSFGLTNRFWKYFKYCLCKTYFVFEILNREWLKILILGKLGLKLVFWKSISSLTHAILFLIFNTLRSVFKNQVIFSKKMFFPDFRLIQTVFRSIKISFKILGEPLSISIDRNCFSINRISWIRFFKNWFWLFQNHFFKSFSELFSLSPIRTWLHLRFLSFLIIFLQGFSLQISVRPFYPSFCFYFHISCIIIWGFRTYTYLGFLMIKAIFSEIDLWVLFLWYFYHDLCWKIWSIWSFGMNSNF